MCVWVAQTCPTLCDPIDCVAHQTSRSVGILQARLLELVAIPFSRRSSQPKDRTQVSCIESRFFSLWATREVQNSRVGPSQIINQVINKYLAAGTWACVRGEVNYKTSVRKNLIFIYWFFFNQDVKSDEVELTAHFLEEPQGYAEIHLPVFPYWKDHRAIMGILFESAGCKTKTVMICTFLYWFFFNWGIVALHCFVGFCYTMKWISSENLISSLLSLPPTPPPSHAPRSSQSTGLGFLCYPADSHWLPVSPMAESMSVPTSQLIPLSPSPLATFTHPLSASASLYSCPANRVVRPFF